MRILRAVAALCTGAAFFVGGVSPATGQVALPDAGALTARSAAKSPPRSGIADFDSEFGTGLTECPQAGEPLDKQPKPLDRRNEDRVEQISNGGDDVRVNQDYACMPQNETSIDVNPTNQRNLVAGVNDYKTAGAGFYASTDGGQHWYEGIIPPHDVPRRNNMENGDPAIAFDRAGVVYFATLSFDRTEDTNGIFANRSTNGGFTWSKTCVAIDETPQNPADANFRCGPRRADARRPGDGVVIFEDDPDGQLNGSEPFNDKEYIATGPRPAGVEPQCFTPDRQPASCAPGTVGVDRVYVTWTQFTNIDARILFSYSDDQGRSWSPPRSISGNAPFCTGGVGDACDLNQFSVPTTSPVTGHLWVAFQNFNTEDENQYLVVRSRDGGQTFEGPFFVTPVFDVNYPRSGSTRPDCTPRGQQNGRAVLTNSCFRVNSGGNIVADRRGGAFADDLYLVMSDNRNGTRASSNADVFLFKSLDGGNTWIGPTRVNDDPSDLGNVSRDCAPSDPGCLGNFGNDQWFPWVDIGDRGDVNVVFYDRRLDRDSVATEWPTSRQRPGNYLTWTWGAQCTVTRADSRECLAAEAQEIPQPDAPVNPGPDPQPGQEQAAFPFRNFTISDVPSNMDYAFAAGSFIGDYNNVAVGPDDQAWSFWTDARNGRSSRNQTGRNPICEQSDVFADGYSARSGGTARAPAHTDELFLVTPCPTDMQEPGS